VCSRAIGQGHSILDCYQEFPDSPFFLARPFDLDTDASRTDFTDISILIRVYPRAKRPCPNERIGKLRLEWVTPQYVKAMHARWEQEGHTSRETGLLVRYIEDGDPEPILCQECNGADGHYDSCKSLGNLETLAELVARGVVKGIQHPSPELVQAMMRYNDEKTVMPY
jgi:hypothetical protein